MANPEFSETSETILGASHEFSDTAEKKYCSKLLWAILESFWGHFGAILDHFGAILDHFGAILDHIGTILVPLWLKRPLIPEPGRSSHRLAGLARRPSPPVFGVASVNRGCFLLKSPCTSLTGCPHDFLGSFCSYKNYGAKSHGSKS